MKSLEAISNEITALETERDFRDITPEETEQLAILNFCYELLARTAIAQADKALQPEEMKEPGFDDEYINRYGITSDELADFTFSLATLSGKINLVALFNQILERARFAPKRVTATEIAEQTGISTNTISTFRNSKGNITADNFEAIINHILSK